MQVRQCSGRSVSGDIHNDVKKESSAPPNESHNNKTGNNEEEEEANTSTKDTNDNNNNNTKYSPEQETSANTTTISDSGVTVHNGQAIKAANKSFLSPSDDIVLEYARRALIRDGRDIEPHAVIWSENTSYPPILAKGKRNCYDYTDDIPLHVRPFWGHEWYQQREYFQSMRHRKSWKQQIVQYGIGGLFVSLILLMVSFLRTWIQQPKEIQELRLEILQHAYGKVLELASGHGQNIGLYPYAVHEIVMCDSNSQQLQTLRYRIPSTAYPKYDVRKMKSEALEDFHDEEFDCVVDMFGLCHFHDPVMALRQMQRVVKPTGIILLLEHGATKYPPVNAFLNYFEKRHLVNTHGCKWNQPVLDYLREARLEIKELKNNHFGTTYYVVAYPENISDLKKSLEKLQMAEG